MTGEFVEFRNNAYTIQTDFGPTRISAEGLTCRGDACPDLAVEAAKVVFGGSATIGNGLMPRILADHAEDSFALRPTNTDQGFVQLQNGEIQVSMATSRITPDLAQAFQSQGAGDMTAPEQEHLLALDSVIVINHPDNPVRQLTFAQLRGIYDGSLTNWAQLGGPDMGIVVLGRPEGSGARTVFEERLFGTAGKPDLPGMLAAKDDAEEAQLVSGIAGAIAYVSKAYQGNTQAITLIDDCGISSMADAFSVRSGAYPLESRLYLYTRADTLTGAGQALVDYATSAEADEVISATGFVDFGIIRSGQEMYLARASALMNTNLTSAQTDQARDMLAQIGGYDRLSTTFRFDPESGTLDGLGLKFQSRLITYLEGQPNGTEVLLAGFADDSGDEPDTLLQSRSRAQQVAEGLRAAANGRLSNITLTAAGYGAIAPVACDTTAYGRRTNRRVEVWIKSPG